MAFRALAGPLPRGGEDGIEVCGVRAQRRFLHGEEEKCRKRPPEKKEKKAGGYLLLPWDRTDFEGNASGKQCSDRSVGFPDGMKPNPNPWVKQKEDGLRSTFMGPDKSRSDL